MTVLHGKQAPFIMQLGMDNYRKSISSLAMKHFRTQINCLAHTQVEVWANGKIHLISGYLIQDSQ